MQVPDKNASMESLVSTLILSGILPVLTLAASLCTNHPLYYQGCTNLLQTASIMSWRMFLKTTDKKHYEHVSASVIVQDIVLSKQSLQWLTGGLGFWLTLKEGVGRRWGASEKSGLYSVFWWYTPLPGNSLYWLCVCVCYFSVWHWCWLQKVTDLTLMCRSDLGVAHY